MAEAVGRTLVCSVLFLDIVGYSKQSVSEQHRVKQAFNDVLAKAIGATPQRDRVILDTGDGAAITFLGDPEDALKISLEIRDGLNLAMPVRMGINLGPVRLVRDLNGQTNIIGDGINVAQRVMSFAKAGQLLVSRSFYEIVSTLSEDYKGLFAHEGARQDKHVRAHDVYSVRDAPPPGKGETDEKLAQLPAEVFDAGDNLIISAYSKARVQEELDRLVQLGARITSEITGVGNKWVASCDKPSVPTLTRVQSLGNTRIVTGPTREVVVAKVDKLVALGATVVVDVECINGVWTAVCNAVETG